MTEPTVERHELIKPLDSESRGTVTLVKLVKSHRPEERPGILEIIFEMDDGHSSREFRYLHDTGIRGRLPEFHPGRTVMVEYSSVREDDESPYTAYLVHHTEAWRPRRGTKIMNLGPAI